MEEAADFVLALLDAAKVEKAALVGHSFGSLVALEAAARAPGGTHLALVGPAYPMKVTPALLENSQHQPMKAIDMVNVYSHSMMAPPPLPTVLAAGCTAARALMRRVLASNPRVNVFHRGFAACDNYAGGEAAIGKWHARCCSCWEGTTP